MQRLVEARRLLWLRGAAFFTAAIGAKTESAKVTYRHMQFATGEANGNLNCATPGEPN